jgi:predicted transcriptional regulator
MIKGIIPSNPYENARVLSTKVSPEFHKQLRQFAAERDATVSAVVKTAVEIYMSKQAH